MNFFDTHTERFFMLLGRLNHQPPCTTRMQAHDLLLKLWIDVARQTGAPSALLSKMKQRTISHEHGWTRITADPCYWSSSTTPGVRISLHHDGTIVMQRINDASAAEIVFFRPGARSIAKRAKRSSLAA